MRGLLWTWGVLLCCMVLAGLPAAAEEDREPEDGRKPASGLERLRSALGGGELRDIVSEVKAESEAGHKVLDQLLGDEPVAERTTHDQPAPAIEAPSGGGAQPRESTPSAAVAPSRAEPLVIDLPALERRLPDADRAVVEHMAEVVVARLQEAQDAGERRKLGRVAVRLLVEAERRRPRAEEGTGAPGRPSDLQLDDGFLEPLRRVEAVSAQAAGEAAVDGLAGRARSTAQRAFGGMLESSGDPPEPHARPLPDLFSGRRGQGIWSSTDTDGRVGAPDATAPPARAGGGGQRPSGRASSRPAPSGAVPAPGERGFRMRPVPSPRVALEVEGGVRIEFSGGAVREALTRSGRLDDLERRLTGLKNAAEVERVIAGGRAEVRRALLGSVEEAALEEVTVLSLATLLERVEPHRKRWDRLPADLAHPGNFARIHGYLPTGDDILLIGVAATRPQTGLHIEELTQAFRTVWQQRLTPVVSLDPNPLDPAAPFVPRIEGMPADSRLAQTLLAADYAMKKPLYGRLQQKIRGWQPITRSWEGLEPAQRAELRRLLLAGRGSRMWLTPAELAPGAVRRGREGRLTLFSARVQVRSDIVQMGRGRWLGKGDTHPWLLALARSATESYDVLAGALSELRRLEVVFDACLLATLLGEQGDAAPLLRRLCRLPVGRVKVQSAYPPLTTVLSQGTPSALPVMGGVSFEPSGLGPDTIGRFDAGGAIDRLEAPLEKGVLSARVGEVNLPVARVRVGHSQEHASLEERSAWAAAQGEEEQAVSLAAQAVRSRPADPGAWSALIRTYASLGLYGLAMRDLESAKRRFGDSMGLRVLTAHLRLLSDDRFDADDLDPPVSDRLAKRYVREAAQVHAEHPRRALGLLELRSRLGPLAARELWLRGSIHTDLGAYAAARSDLAAGLALEPKSEMLWTASALLYVQKEAWDAARRAADAALALRPDSAYAHVLKAQAVFRADPTPAGIQEASELVRQARRLDPDSGYGAYLHAKILEAQGYHDAAIAATGRAIALLPTNAQAYVERSRLRSDFDFRQQLEFEAGAFRDLNTALHLRPRHLEARRRRSAMLEGLFRRINAGNLDVPGEVLFGAVPAGSPGRNRSGLLTPVLEEHGSRLRSMAYLEAARSEETLRDAGRARSVMAVLCFEAATFDLEVALREAARRHGADLSEEDLNALQVRRALMLRTLEEDPK